ncbi:MAG: hypothetical protein KC931_09865 [Candidatus Omnitrophica bacterium]|nr:hypothetical protein [Candidatus Omnitrophota bacterium]
MGTAQTGGQPSESSITRFRKILLVANLVCFGGLFILVELLGFFSNNSLLLFTIGAGLCLGALLAGSWFTSAK